MTHAYLGLIAFDLLLTAAGYGVLYALGLVRTRRQAIQSIGLAFIVGWAAVGVLLSLGVMLGVDPGVVQVLLLAALIVAVSVRLARTAPPLEADRRPGPPGRLGRLVALLGAGLLALTLSVATASAARARPDMAWDVWSFWLPKAMALYFFSGLDTGLSGYTTYAHVEYPPLVPVVHAASFHFMGGVYPMLLPLQQSLLAAGFVGAAAVILATRVPGWVLFPALAMLMLAPQVWNGMVTVLPDQTLSYLLALAAVASVLWLDEGRRAWLGLAVVLLAAAALTKLEGVLFGGVLALIVVVTSCLLRGRRGLPALILLLGPLAIVPWRVWLASHDLRTTSPDYALSDLLDPDYLGDRVGNLTLAIRHTLDLVFDSDRWTPTLALTLAVLLLLAPVLRMLSAVVVTWLVLSFLAIATVYWIGRPEIHWYLNTSAYRVAAVLPFVAGTLLPLLLGIALSREAMTRERVRTVEHGTAAPATTEAPRTLTRIRGRAHSRE